MVNYCCVYGCGRNNKIHKHLTYYSLPRSKERQEQWLQAAGREDLLGKSSYKSIRLCSRHFEPSQIKKRHLAPDAIPTLSLPGYNLTSDTQDNGPERHNGLICNGCSDPIIGFRYKCVTCNDYDLCQKCEMLEVHPDHLMLRINRPMKFITIDNLIKKWRDLVKCERGVYDDCKSGDDNGYLSSDDEPITKYTKDNDNGVNIPEEVKNRIRKEIARVLKSRNEQDANKVKKDVNKKRPAEGNKPSKRLRKEVMSGDEKETDDSDDQEVEELAFADVDDVKLDKMIKSETTAASSTEQEKDMCVEMINEAFI